MVYVGKGGGIRRELIRLLNGGVGLYENGCDFAGKLFRGCGRWRRMGEAEVFVTEGESGMGEGKSSVMSL